LIHFYKRESQIKMKAPAIQVSLPFQPYPRK